MDQMPADVKYRYGDRCRQRAYREKVKREAEAAGLSPTLTLAEIQATNGTQRRNGDAQTRRKGAQRSRSGLQVSHRKAVDAVARAITHAREHQAVSAESLARRYLDSILSPRQREVLAERSGTRMSPQPEGDR
jgi:hypothetical protein